MDNSSGRKLDKEAFERAIIILEAYFDGNLASTTEEKVRGWLASEDNRAEKDAALQSMWMKKVDYDPSPGRYAYSSLEEMRGLLGFPREMRSSGKAGRKILLRIAAVLVPVLFIAGLAYVTTRGQGSGEEITEQVAETITVSAPGDKREYVVLPDGSEVWINRSGKIVYSSDFEKKRVVHLDGEAYFAVTKKNGMPFEVLGIGNDLAVKVLGTEFNVVCYDGDDTAVVSLRKGSVEVTAYNETRLLEPLEELICNRLNEGHVVRKVDEKEIAAWRSRRMVFEDTQLGDVFQAISDSYNVRFAIDENLPLDRKIRVRFDENDSLEDVLFVIQKTIGTFECEVKKDMVIITKRKAPDNG